MRRSCCSPSKPDWRLLIRRLCLALRLGIAHVGALLGRSLPQRSPRRLCSSHCLLIFHQLRCRQLAKLRFESGQVDLLWLCQTQVAVSYECLCVTQDLVDQRHPAFSVPSCHGLFPFLKKLYTLHPPNAPSHPRRWSPAIARVAAAPPGGWRFTDSITHQEK